MAKTLHQQSKPSAARLSGGAPTPVNPFDAGGRSVRSSSGLRGGSDGTNASDERRRDKPTTRMLQAAKRNLSLLTEYRTDDRSSKFADHRVDVKSHELSESARVVKRLKALHKGKAKRGKFNLDDDDGTEGSIFGESLMHTTGKSSHDGGLTRLAGLSDKALTEDAAAFFANREAAIEDNEEMSRAIVDETLKNNDSTRKTRKEIFEEIMIKSKTAKAERAVERDKLEEQRERIDNSFAELKNMLQFRPTKSDILSNALTKSSDNVNRPQQRQNDVNAAKDASSEDLAFEQIVRNLKYSQRLAPSERKKTAAELAEEQAKRLKELEASRVSRMIVDAVEPVSEDEDSEEVGESGATESDQEGEEEEEEEEEEERCDGQTDTDGEGDEADDIFDGMTDNLSDSELLEVFDDQRTRIDKEATAAEQPPRSGVEDSKLIVVESSLPEWMRNDESEASLPFVVDVPKSCLAWHVLLQGLPPKSQDKIIRRMRVGIDSVSSPERAAKIRMKFFRFLLEYMTESLSLLLSHNMSADVPVAVRDEATFPGRTERFIATVKGVEQRRAQSRRDATELRIDAIKSQGVSQASQLLKTLQPHMLDFLDRHSSQAAGYCRSRLYPVLLRSFPNCPVDRFRFTDSDSATEQALRAPQQSPEVLALNFPLPAELAILKLIQTLFPMSDRRHVITIPAMVVLDAWATRLSTVAFHKTPMASDSELSEGVIPPADGNLLWASLVLLSLLRCGTAQARRYCPSFFGLSMAVLHRLAIDCWCCEECEKALSCKRCGKLSVMAAMVASATGNTLRGMVSDGCDACYVPCVHLLGQTLSYLLASCPSYGGSHRTASISAVHTALTGLQEIRRACETRSLVPLNLHGKKAKGIVMLTPSYVNVMSDKKAAQRLRFGPDLELSRRRQLTRQVNKERRDAARQLRKDSKFVASLRTMDKRRHNAAQDQRYRAVTAMLQQDQAEFKKMRTTGGGMDTSLKPFRAKKKQKQQNRTGQSRGGRTGVGAQVRSKL